jgi:hypothetical protein
MLPKPRSSIALAVAMLVGMAASAGAQTGADTTATEPAPAEASPTTPSPTPAPMTEAAPSSDLKSMLRGGVAGELLAIHVPRSEPEIQKLLDDARSLEQYAKSEIEEGRRLASEAEGRAKAMRQEMDDTKEKRGAAKKAKDKPQAEALDATYKQQSREERYLSHLNDALRADIDRMESSKDAAGAQIQVLQLELQVARQQAALGASPTASALTQFTTSLRKMLEAQRVAAEKGRLAADKRKRVAEERLKQLDALAKVGK